MMYFTFFCTITLFILLFFIFIEERKKRMARRLKVFLDASEEKSGMKEQKKNTSLWKKFFHPALHTIKRSFKKKISGEKEAKIEMKLLQAGSPFGMTPVDFRLLQISLLLGLPTLFGILGTLLHLSFKSFASLVLIHIIFGAFIPHHYLQIKAKERRKQALKELPDMVDLLTVSLEAGLGFDSALSKLISKKTGVLSSEFHRCLEEIRLGKTRRDALKGIQERLLVDELHVLINSILQAEKLGISMVHILRIQSQEVRQMRKQRAEEAAMKAPIKMLFPLVLFIFPSLFIVLLGPAVIQFLKVFTNH